MLTPVSFVDRYPLIVTPLKNECRDFWVAHLGFEVGFDSSWFVWLHAPDHSATIAFMTPDHPSAPPGSDAFSGKGVAFEMQVSNAEEAHGCLKAAGVPISYALTKEPFGQKRFGFFDPSGLWIDVCEQTDSAEGFWDRYLISET